MNLSAHDVRDPSPEEIRAEMGKKYGPRIMDRAEPLLRHVPLAGFMQTDPATIDWALYPFIPKAFLTLLGAHGGAGKSTLSLIWAAHMACGFSWCGLHPGGVLKTLVVSLEDSGELVRYRLRRVCEAYGLDAALVESNVTVLDGAGGDGSLMVEVNDFGVRTLCRTPVMEELEIMAPGYDLIVIDNASDAYSGNEIDRRGVRTFCRALTDIARANNAAVVLLAHIDKQAARNGSAGNSYSGSTAWHNSARSRLALIPREDGTVDLVHEKSNLGKCADTILLGWSDQGVLVPREADPGATGQQRDDDASSLLPALAAAHQAGISVSTAGSGPVTSWHALEPLEELGEQFRGKQGKRRVFAGLLELQKRGAIKRTVYTNHQRNTRERWELTQNQPASASNPALVYIPIPQGSTNAPTDGALVPAGAPTNATNATDAASYRTAKDGNA